MLDCENKGCRRIGIYEYQGKRYCPDCYVRIALAGSDVETPGWISNVSRYNNRGIGIGS